MSCYLAGQCATVAVDDNEAYLVYYRTDKEYRGRGIGKPVFLQFNTRSSPVLTHGNFKYANYPLTLKLPKDPSVIP